MGENNEQGTGHLVIRIERITPSEAAHIRQAVGRIVHDQTGGYVARVLPPEC